MKQMKKILGGMMLGLLFSLGLSAQQTDALLTSYETFLKKQQTSAKDYVLGLFEKYDIVVLCERDHREWTQYDLILDILADERFTYQVGKLYTEIGNVHHNEELNAFLHHDCLTQAEADAKVMDLHRNAYGASMWEKANYSYLLKGMHRINQSLPEKRKVSLFNLDLGIKDWKTATIDEIRLRDSLMPQRDSLLADNFFRIYQKQGDGKALVIMNYRHAFLQDVFGRVNFGRFIAEAYPGKVANVFISSFAVVNDPKCPMRAIAGGHWDASFKKSGKLNVGFDLKDSPFGFTPFDLIPIPNKFTYSEFFTGMVYYGFFPEYRLVSGMEGFVDKAFLPELMRRYELDRKAQGSTDLPDPDELMKYYNTVTDVRYQDDPMLEIAVQQIGSFF